MGGDTKIETVIKARMTVNVINGMSTTQCDNLIDLLPGIESVSFP